MSGFRYKPRTTQQLDKRASASGPGEFESFVLAEYNLYQPKKGENWIRILPPTWDDPEHYGLITHVHYGIGPDRAAVLCRSKMHNQKCPICEAQAKARGAGDEELSKELRAASRVLVWLIDRNDEAKGPLLWAMPWTVDRDIIKVSRDRQTGEYYAIDDPAGGYDVTFDREGEGVQVKYNGMSIARKPSKVNSKHLQFVVDNPLPGVLRDRSYAEVLALFEGAKEAEDDAPPAKKRAKSAPADDDEEDAPPAKKRRPADDDDDEPPAPKTRRKLEVEDDDIPFDGAKPKRRAVQDDDEDEPPPPKKRRAVQDDDEDEPPPPKKRAPPPDDDEDEPPPPKKRAAKVDDPADDDEEEPPAKPKRKVVQEDDEEEPAKEMTPAQQRVAALKNKFKR